MEFIKEIIKNRKLIFRLGKSDFKNRFAGTSLGAIWGFIQPFIFMAMYVIVFQYILKTKSGGDDPFIVWYLPGMAMWMLINDNILNVTVSIRNYSYLVKKVVFPIDTIPVISLISTSITSIFIILIALIICIIYGYVPNILLMLYYIFAAFCFLIGFTRMTSAITTLVPDFGQLLSVVMQVLFWFTPILWDITAIVGTFGGKLIYIIKCMPFAYLVTGLRESVVGGNLFTEGYGIYTIIFWIITIGIFIWSNHIFKKCKKDFADVL